MLCGMVGHPGQRFVGGNFPGQSMALPYTQAALMAATQPSQNILAHGALYYPQDIYGLLAKQQHSPLDQNTLTDSQQDHPIGYGAFGVVW